MCVQLITLVKSLDRCASIDETLSRLARNYPSTKFLRARAGAIGFASSSGSRPGLASGTSFGLSRVPARRPLANIRRGVQERDEFFDDDHDEGSDDDGGEDEDEDQWEDDEVDTDVLPTLLVYRGGELVHSWVRVDWEAKQGLEDFLKRYRAIASHRCIPDRGLISCWACRHGVLTSPWHYGGVSANGGHASDEDDIDDGDLVFGNSDDER